MSEIKVGDRVKIKDEIKANPSKYLEVWEYLENNGYNVHTKFTITKLTNRTMFSGDFPLALKFVELVNNKEELQNTERYTTGSGKQLYDIMEDDLLEPDEARGFYKGNIYKYVKRYPKKNGIEDLEKARDYINQLIELEKKLGEIS